MKQRKLMGRLPLVKTYLVVGILNNNKALSDYMRYGTSDRHYYYYYYYVIIRLVHD